MKTEKSGCVCNPGNTRGVQTAGWQTVVDYRIPKMCLLTLRVEESLFLPFKLGPGCVPLPPGPTGPHGEGDGMVDCRLWYPGWLMSWQTENWGCAGAKIVLSHWCLLACTIRSITHHAVANPCSPLSGTNNWSLAFKEGSTPVSKMKNCVQSFKRN